MTTAPKSDVPHPAVRGARQSATEIAAASVTLVAGVAAVCLLPSGSLPIADDLLQPLADTAAHGGGLHISNFAVVVGLGALVWTGGILAARAVVRLTATVTRRAHGALPTQHRAPVQFLGRQVPARRR